MFTKLYLISLFLMGLVDVVWIGVISKSFYQKHIGFLMTEQVNYIAAAIFYLIYAAAIVFFVVNPAIEKRSITDLIIKAAFLGLVCYGTYDLTNMAVVKGWNWTITIIDILWGTFVTMLSSLLTYAIAMKFLIK